MIRGFIADLINEYARKAPKQSHVTLVKGGGRLDEPDEFRSMAGMRARKVLDELMSVPVSIAKPEPVEASGVESEGGDEEPWLPPREP